VASVHSHSADGWADGVNGVAAPARPSLGARRTELAGNLARYLGAVSLLLVGAVHAQQYYGAYFSFVPTIGTLFLLSFIGSGVLGAVLLAPVRKLGRDLADLILGLAALGGIGIAAGSLVSLLISEYTPLFGFMESGYRLAVVLAIVFDALTTVLLGVFVLLVAHARWHRGMTERPGSRSAARPTQTITTERRTR
jgi:hypothetical protein